MHLCFIGLQKVVSKAILGQIWQTIKACAIEQCLIEALKYFYKRSANIIKILNVESKVFVAK